MKFPSLLSGINYQTACPICAGPMKIDTRDAELDTSCDYSGHQKRTLTWHQDGVLVIDLDTEEFSLTIKQPKAFCPVLGYSGSSGSYASSPVYKQFAFNGTVYIGLGIECQNCCQYSFGLKIILDTDGKGQGQISTELNSEILSIEDKVGDLVHEIKNIYSTNQTEYTYFAGTRNKEFNTWNDKTVILPLIPLDVRDPSKALNRIKTLVIFS